MLEALYAGALEDASSRAEFTSINQLEKLIATREPAKDALKVFAPRTNIHVLAEIKRASPSKGELAAIPEPTTLARSYVDNGATGISVLTEERRFRGSLADFDAVRTEVAVPLLRKDFLASEYQILESRAHGADIALLIVAGLDKALLRRLFDLTQSLGMTPFIETHTAEELEIALELDAKFIGVNARDLSTFETDRNLFESLVHKFPSDVIKVAESAVRTVEDVKHYRDAGADVVLVGEALVTGDAGEQLKLFLEVE